MKYVRLGKTDLNVSRVALGCGNFGVKYKGAPSKADSIKSVHKALDIGINFFDTANVYGFWRSESILAEAVGSLRNKVVITTKGGVTRTPHSDVKFDLSYDNIIKSVEDSLVRLKTDYIDLYLTHWPDDSTPIAETSLALEHLIKEGKVRYVGASNVAASHIEQYISQGCFDVVQLRYNLLYREIEDDILPLCSEQDIGVLAYSPLYRGLLTGKFTLETKFAEGDGRKNQFEFKGATFKQYLAIVEKLKKFAHDHGTSAIQLAVAWVLRKPEVHSAIYGVSKPEQVIESLGENDWGFSDEDFLKIEKMCSMI